MPYSLNRSLKIFISIFIFCNGDLNGQNLIDSSIFANTIYDVDINLDGSKIFAAGKDSTLIIYDRKGQLIQKLKGHNNSVSSIDYDHSSNTILTSSYDNSAILWGMDGKILSRLVGHSEGVIDVTRNENTIGTASRDKTAKIWDTNGNLKFSLIGHTAQVNTILFEPTNKWIITASKDHSLKIWNYQGRLINTITHHRAGIKTIKTLLNKSLFVVGYEDGNISLIDFNGDLIKTIQAHDEMISDIQVIGNDHYFIAGSADRKISIWSINGELIQKFQAHNSYVSGLAFSNNILVSSSGDKSIKVWKIDQQKIQSKLDSYLHAIASAQNILTAYYDCISGPIGIKRDFERLKSLFHPKARLIYSKWDNEITEASLMIFNIDEFIDNLGYLDKKGFYEEELSNEIHAFGSVIQVFSTYKYWVEDKSIPEGRGITSYELFFDGERYWIMSMFWNAENEKYTIPEIYLK